MKWSSDKITWQHISKRHDLVSIIAHWFQNEWAAYDPECTVASRAAELYAKKDPKALPLTVVATDQNELLGTYSLDLTDLAIRPNLSPWLASVFVNPGYRNQGIGTLLVQHAVRHAQSLGISTLFLFTAHHASWYAYMSLQSLEEVSFQGEILTIMQLAKAL